MKTTISLRFMAIFWGLLAVAATAVAIEPSDMFLKALRDAEYFDIASDYLERAEKSPATTVTFKRNIPYERGLLFFDASRVERDPALRQGFLDKSKASFEAFLASKPQGAIVVQANKQLGNLIVEHARIKLGEAKENKTQQVALTKEASKLYKEAYAAFDASVKELLKRLQALPKVIPESDKKRIAERDELRKSYLEALLLRAAIREESAEAEKAGGPEYAAILADAGKQYGLIYEKYRTRLAGLYAVLYQGRCLQKIKKWEDALSIYAELLETGEEDDPALRNLKTKVLLQGMECWVALKQPKEALERVGPWVDDVRPSEEEAQDWIDLRMTYLKFLVDTALAKKNPKDEVAKKAFSAAGELIVSLAKVSGDHQKQLRSLRTKIPQNYIKGKIADATDFKTFVEARDAGREALGTYQQNHNLTTILPGQIRKTKDAGVKQALTDQLTKAKEEKEPSRKNAMNLFSKSLNLATESTDIEDVNIVRYFLCYLHYTGAEYYEAATIGEFLSRTYPQSAGVRQCAKIAMASYLKLYSELGNEDDKSFETKRTIEIATYIADQWPDKAEAQEALGTLIPFLIQAGRLDEAEGYLQKIPEDSPRRGESELKTGQAFWSNYLRTAKTLRELETAGTDEAKLAEKRASLKELKTRAEKMLSDGIARMKAAGKADGTMASAVLSLAQIYVDTDQASKAAVLLEDPEIGALILVRKKDPSTSREGFATETYRTALRAYIYSLGDAPDPDKVVAKAEGVMDDLANSMDPDRLIAMYVSLAQQLKESMDIATPEVREKLAKGFETFLDGVKEGATEFSILNWVAATYYEIGKGFDNAATLTPRARTYYAKAISTYTKVLTITPPAYKIQLQKKVADTHKRMGDFSKAIRLFKEILTKKSTYLSLQEEAGLAYHQWGLSLKKSGKDEEAAEKFLAALRGAELHPVTKKPIIWGWSAIAKRTAGKPGFETQFHRSRQRLVETRIGLASCRTGADRAKTLEQALQDIEITQQLFDLGTPQQRAGYDDLMKRVQRELGVTVTGLGEPAAAE